MSAVNKEQQKVRIAARRTVRNAIKAGRLERKPCEVCGDLEVQAHHDDYSQPLKVRWVCVAHHRLIHMTKTLRNSPVGSDFS
jgi:hypothetical protein